MIKRERAMVDSLDLQGSRRPSAPEQTTLASPLAKLSVTSPVAARRRLSIVAENRSTLLAGVPPSEASSLVSAVGRRQSAPTVEVHTLRRGQLLRQQLRTWGHVYYGSAASADIAVAGTALRRSSNASTSSEDGSETMLDRLVIRARVRPRTPERKPFVMQRTFDVAALRATVPDPMVLSAEADGHASGPAVVRRRSTSAGAKSGMALDLRRKPFLDSNAVPIRTLSLSSFPPALFSVVGSPIAADLDYARLHLPVLAALMLSGHIRGGDIIDLPMPHPEVWPQTVAYVYTGREELTHAMKLNILHLGGRV